MIRNFIFDMGNVVLHYRPDWMAQRFSLHPENAQAVREAIFSCREWALMDEGMVTEEDFLRIVLERNPRKLHDDIVHVFAHWHEAMTPIEGAEEFILARKREGRRVYLLSNASERLYSYYKNISAMTHFDGMVVSATEKLVKPDVRIFERLCKRFDLLPEECFFLDDVAANIEGAKKAGLNGCVFDGDYAKLTRELTQSGVL